jgi:Zn-dependent protease
MSTEEKKESKKKSILYFSKQEKIDLAISYLSLSIAFSFVLMNFNVIGELTGGGRLENPILAIPIAFIAVATGFVCHEMAHREMAKHFGFHSEYRAWYPMLGIAIIFAIFTSWILAVPGATYFFGQNVSRKQNGIISLAGPVSNLILGMILIVVGIFSPTDFWAIIFISAAQINFWFAFFNMLPIFLLDGVKVLEWKGEIWLGMILLSGLLVFFPEILMYLLGGLF